MDPASRRPTSETAPKIVSPVIWMTGLGAVAVILVLLFSVVMG